MTDPTEPTRRVEPTDPPDHPHQPAAEEAMTTPTSPAETDVFTAAEPAPGAASPSSTARTPGANYAPTMTYAGPPAPEAPKGPRMRTTAWGLVLALLGAVVIAVGLGVHLDLQLVFIGILAVAGLTLLIGSLASGVRKR